MAELYLLDSPTDPTIGGVAIKYPSNATKSATWRSETPIADTLAMAKQIAAQLLQERLDTRNPDDAERTNWVSVTAAIQAHVKTWNEKRRENLLITHAPHLLAN